MNNATIYDVAGAAGVSLATVSRVLNNPEKVAPKTRDKVLKVIKELNYRPNLIARGLASSKTTTVGVLISDITRASVAEMLGGIIDIAQTYKYTIKIFTFKEEDNVFDAIQNIVAEQVDGVLFLNDELSNESVSLIKETFNGNKIPFVFSNVYTKDVDIPSVEIDYEKASYDLTKMMIADGRKDIYFLSTKRNYSVNDSKEIGYEKAMKEAGLETKVFLTSGNTAINKPHFEEFFADKNVDAAIAVRDSIAVSFMNMAIKYGKKVPQDLAIAGFQNTKYAELARPTLSTIDIPVYDIGAVAMRLLTKMMSNKHEEIESIKIQLPHMIIKRETTN